MPVTPMFPLRGGDAARRGTAAADLRTALLRNGFRLPGHDDPAFGVVLIAAGREVGGGDTRSDVGALAHITECADFGDGRYRLRW